MGSESGLLYQLWKDEIILHLSETGFSGDLEKVKYQILVDDVVLYECNYSENTIG